MGIPLWESSPTKSLDKSLASSRCNTSSSRDEESEEWTTNPPRSGSSSTSSATSTSTSSATSTGTSMATVIALTARDEPTPRSRRDGSSSTDNSMLTLDEFLRETSQASAASNEAERHLQTLLLAHRRSDRDRPGSEDWRRSLFDHTPSASARLRLTSSGTASLSPPSPTGNDRPGIDSFDTLVSQIRRIGALQDAMLSTVDDTTASLEDSTINRTSGGGTTVEGERRRSAVDSLRVREARLRAMQTRIDLLASEFQLLRSTRRELRRVLNSKH
ncbi:hypothetical protein BDD12DRAFT_253432 [Trichophaea hybrida]|nr:hypothetical protein BDD12DRAFT_253432 [Trichophaea hybrida]